MTTTSLNAIGVVGSNSTTNTFKCDILEDNINESLLGKLVFFFHRERNVLKCIIGQITSVKSRNPWHEDMKLRAVIKRRGRLDYLSGDTDIKMIDIALIGCYDIEIVDNDDSSSLNNNESIYNTIINNNRKIRLRPAQVYTPPSTGTEIYLFNEELQHKILENLFENYNVVYLGYIYGSNTKAPFNLAPFSKDRG